MCFCTTDSYCLSIHERTVNMVLLPCKRKATRALYYYMNACSNWPWKLHWRCCGCILTCQEIHWAMTPTYHWPQECWIYVHLMVWNEASHSWKDHLMLVGHLSNCYFFLDQHLWKFFTSTFSPILNSTGKTWMDELPVIGFLCLRQDFWDRPGANIAIQ